MPVRVVTGRAGSDQFVDTLGSNANQRHLVASCRGWWKLRGPEGCPSRNGGAQVLRGPRLINLSYDNISADPACENKWNRNRLETE